MNTYKLYFDVHCSASEIGPSFSRRGRKPVPAGVLNTYLHSTGTCGTCRYCRHQMGVHACGLPVEHMVDLAHLFIAQEVSKMLFAAVRKQILQMPYPTTHWRAL